MLHRRLLWTRFAWAGLFALAGTAAANAYVPVTGRRDPRIYAIDLKAALLPRTTEAPARSSAGPLDLAFECWPDPEGLALAHGSDGKTYLVSGNGGTEDVSIMDLDN